MCHDICIKELCCFIQMTHYVFILRIAYAWNKFAFLTTLLRTWLKKTFIHFLWENQIHGTKVCKSKYAKWKALTKVQIDFKKNNKMKLNRTHKKEIRSRDKKTSRTASNPLKKCNQLIQMEVASSYTLQQTKE